MEEKKNNLKYFNNPIPSREVSLINSISYAKKNIISVLKKEIFHNLPKNIKLQKKENVAIIKI